MVMTLFLQPLNKPSISCLFTSIFVLEPKACAMNYGHSKELSTNKARVVTEEKKRTRNLKLGLRQGNKQAGFFKVRRAERCERALTREPYLSNKTACLNEIFSH